MTLQKDILRICWLVTLACAAVVGAGRIASADGPFAEMVVFGASFDDPTSRFTNGLLWNEWLASELDMPAPLASTREGGTNYSVSGETTSQMRGQVRQYLREHLPDTSTLLTFSFGAMGNDFRVSRRADPERSAINVTRMISDLADAGGTFFMVPTAAQAGLSPINRSQAQAWEEFFVNFDAALNPRLSELEANMGLTIYRPDIFQLTMNANQNPESYGLTNATGRADQGSNNPHEYMWWDDWHPTTAVHRLAGHEAFKSMNLEVHPDVVSLGVTQQSYSQGFEELGRGRINTPLPDGWVGVTDGAQYTSITGLTTTRIGAGGSLFNLGDGNDRTLAMGVTDSSQQNEIQLLAEITDMDVGALQLGFDVEAWGANRHLASSPGEAAYNVLIEADSGQGYMPLADFSVSTGPVLSPPTRGSSVDGNLDANRVVFNSDIVPTNIPAGSNLRVRWVVPADSQTAHWTYGVDNVELSVLGQLQAGDADQDYDFDQIDLVRVQQAAKYLTGEPATWGQGDWDGAPSGYAGAPPVGNGLFDQLDIVAAQQAGLYLAGRYAAVKPNGVTGDGQTSVGYNAYTGEIWVDPPPGRELTSINIDSASGIFTGQAAANLGGSFDNDADHNIFKATFGASFGSVSFDNVAQTGLSKEFVRGDLSVVGSLAGGGDLGSVDLVYVPEPTSVFLLAIGLMIGLTRAGYSRNCESIRPNGAP